MKYLILGAGPAGLTFAHRLKEAGETSFLVLEKEGQAGGLCRSVIADGAPFDIGGGHFLDVRRPKVNEFLFRFMPEEEWNIFDRDSRIDLKGHVISHPLEANIWQLPVEWQVDYLKSIAAAGCSTGKPMPERFTEWICWKLGSRISEDYMLPYNRKLFGSQLDELGTYWLNKLPEVSFEEVLLSCLNKQAYGNQPGHARFYYPKQYGYGELWLRMAEELGDQIEYHREVAGIDFNRRTITTKDQCIYQAENIITTIPWQELSDLTGMPEELRRSIGQLKHVSVQTEYQQENLDTAAHWIYHPDPNIPYHRTLVRSNFCPGARGHWTETNGDRVLSEAGRARKDAYYNKYAYPLNTLGKPQIMEKLLHWARSKGVYGLGRWGEHEHYNSDLTAELSIRLGDRMLNMCGLQAADAGR